jgi:Protein of unknown function (DUF3892)
VPNEVRCINKTNRWDAHDRIHAIGGINTEGNVFKVTSEQAIAGIESGNWAFVVRQAGRTVSVIVATRLGRKYLKTVADGEQPDNLLSLPECP